MVLKYKSVDVVHGLLLPAETSESESEALSTAQSADEHEQQRDRRSPRKQRECPPLVGRDLSAVRAKAERRRAGVRRRRRYENHCGLKQTLEALVEETEPVVQEPIVVQSRSAFNTLFTDTQNMKVWEEFVDMTPAKQEKVVADMKKQRAAKETEVCMMTPLERYCCIDRNIRIVLRKHNLPDDTLKDLETELINFFGTDFDDVYVCKFGSFKRLLLHGLCQYLGFQSSSENVDGVRITTVRLSGPFARPTVLLSTLMETARSIEC